MPEDYKARIQRLAQPLADQAKGSVSSMMSALRGAVAPSPPMLQPPHPPIAPMFTLGYEKPRGMLSEGNINLNERPIVHNADGSISSEYSMSSGDEYGHESLYPSIANGKWLTPSGMMPANKQESDQLVGYRDANGSYHPGSAQRYSENTGQNMGIFDNPDDADAYANAVHERPMQFSDPWGPNRMRIVENPSSGTVRNIGKK